MARPLSSDKRDALLRAATQAVAELGVLATTSSIARSAGVAEGSLFTYFTSKDELFQEVYLHLKRSLAETIMPDYPSGADYRQRMEHVFQRYVSWGLASATGRLAVARLTASGQMQEGTRSQGMQAFQAVTQMLEDGVGEGVLIDAPIGFLASLIEHIADTVIEQANKCPDEAERHRQLGFHVLWRAISS